MMFWSALLLAFAGFTLIAATMERHGESLHMPSLGERQLLAWRLGGYVLLAISLLPCLMRWGPSVALAAWLGLLSFAAGALALMFTYFSRHVRHAAALSSLLGLAFWLAAS
ncbi:DUF3325 domain-containing protein [Comamonas composti]|uniref:DUF3325 domain-containing protein n=1 Tax=Comamonas composti TaxID=408558 RepID=UPI0004029DDD|nr:DUF3325 domain-containing protein [Comamonas composti]